MCGVWCVLFVFCGRVVVGHFILINIGCCFGCVIDPCLVLHRNPVIVNNLQRCKRF